ncbi:MAG: nucleotidyltransferase family protein [Peptococcaceae bacterium]|jgi:molybdopterin-guanine dinucleotide biosynthesis protein A|nr:nucleotidyltransferase family protein [Peptococcaceae bacterium]MDH7526088.1 nucleotidyltransferase family protein [Peptococcaceae bacterium]
MVVGVILAGGRKNGLTAGQTHPVDEAFISIGKRYMIEYVAEALEASPYINRIIISGPLDRLVKVFQESERLTLVQSGETVIDSFRHAFQAARPSGERLLVVTADIPLLSTRAVDDFLESCFRQSGDLFYPIISKETNENKYPGVKRTYVNLKEGLFTGGNLFFFDPAIVERCLPLAEKLVLYRKKPIRLATFIGWGVLVRYVLGILSLKDAERAVSRMMGIKGVAVISPYPEIGIDVDKHSDLDLAEKILCS